MTRLAVVVLFVVAVSTALFAPADVRVPPQVFLSEYVEGADGEAPAPFDKAIELTNATGFPVDLENEGYFLQIWSYNGSLFSWELAAEVSLVGVMAPDDVFVIVNAFTNNSQLLAAADQLSDLLFFDGDDALLLVQLPVKSPERQVVYWDVIGWIAGPPPPGGAWTNGSLSTQDMDLRRSADLVIPDLDPFDGFTLDPDQWQGFSPDSFGGLGVGGFIPVQLVSFTAE